MEPQGKNKSSFSPSVTVHILSASHTHLDGGIPDCTQRAGQVQEYSEHVFFKTHVHNVNYIATFR